VGREVSVTLAGDLDAVVDADGLAVVQGFSLLLAKAGVVEVLEVRHCELKFWEERADVEVACGSGTCDRRTLR
jgi:diaminopimelate epimerase